MSPASDLVYDRYQTGQGNEWLLRIGPAKGLPILIVPPLFEELNRTRALIVTFMRALAAKGHGCRLLDLPGTGESERALDGCSWNDWRQAVADCALSVARQCKQKPAMAAFRGGALLDDKAEAACFWRFAPATGASLVRDLERSSLVSPREQNKESLELAGYPLGTGLLEPLRSAASTDLPHLRVVRLATDPADADRKIAGPALWRRSEPGNSAELAAELAADLDQWIDQCAS